MESSLIFEPNEQRIKILDYYYKMEEKYKNNEKVLRRIRLELAKRYYWFFFEYYFQNKIKEENLEMDGYHGYLCEQVQRAIMRDGSREIFIAPRGFAKTLTVGEGVAVWLLLHPDMINYKTVMYLCSGGRQASARAEFVKNHLYYNDFILRDYQPELYVCNAENVRLKNRGWVTFRGAGMPIRGEHPQIVIVDDLETEAVKYSEYERTKLRIWYETAFFNILTKKSSLFIIGTFNSQHSILYELVHDPAQDGLAPKEGYNVHLHYARYREEFGKYVPDINGDIPLCPRMWPIEALEKRRKEIGSAAFAMEYMHNPINESHIIIPYNKLISCTLSDINFNEWDLWLAIDPAFTTGRRAHYTGICLCATDGEKVYIVESKKLKVDTILLLEDIMYYKVKYPTLKNVVIESEGQQSSFVQMVQDKFLEKKIDMNVTPITTKKVSKFNRVMLMLPYIERGDVYIIEENNKELMNDLQIYTSEKDESDVIDALAHCFKMIVDYSLGKKQEKRIKEVIREQNIRKGRLNRVKEKVIYHPLTGRKLKWN